MTHKHAILETAPIEFLGSLQASHAHELTCLVDLGRLAVEHMRQLALPCYRVNNLLQCIGRVEGIAGIQEA